VQYEKEIIRSSPAVDAFSQQALHAFQYTSINHKRRFSASARVPSSTICLFQYGLSSTLVQPLSVKVPGSSTMKVSCHAFGFASLAFEPVTLTKSSANAAIEVQASAVKTNSNNALPFGSKLNKSFEYTSFFGDKPSSTNWLVVASVNNEDFKGQTNDSPAKQRPVPNDNPAIEISLQLCIPMIPNVSATLTTKLTHILAIMTALNGQNLLLLCVQDNSAITMAMATRAKCLLLHCIQDDPSFLMATHTKLKLQLIVAFIQRALSARSTISIQEKLIVILHSEGEPDGCRLIVSFIPILHFEVTHEVQTNLSSKISSHFCDNCRIFCEGGEWENDLIGHIGLAGRDHICIIKQQLILVGQISCVGHIGLDNIIGCVGQTGFVGLVGQICSVSHIGFIGLIKPICLTTFSW
jgi:hypothetical protein